MPFVPPAYAPPVYAPPVYDGGSSSSGVVAFPYFERDLLEYLGTLGLAVYPGHIPQGAALPAITFLIISSDHAYRLASAAGIAEDHVQVTVSSRAYSDCGKVSEQLRQSLGFVQQLMGATWVYSVVLANRTTQYEPGVDASDKGVHSKINEFVFTYEDSIPTLTPTP